MAPYHRSDTLATALCSAGKPAGSDPDIGHVIAVLLPMSGEAGLWGPSCIACAQLALHEINRDGGIQGECLQPIFLDADAGKIDALHREMAALIDARVIRAVVGMTVSSVRQRLNLVIRGRVPFIYTPLYEGNERAANVFAIGETPSEQLAPAIVQLTRSLGVRRWALVGNDYVWPRVSHAVARRVIRRHHGEVVFERYVPFGLVEPAHLLDSLARSRPDIVIVSLVGQDAVEFNRSFGAMNLDRQMFRFSSAIDENVLLATGGTNTKRLYVASAYFANLDTQRNQAFRERYRAMHTVRPPVLNALGQSVYEGMSLYASMAGSSDNHRLNAPVNYRSARCGQFISNQRRETSIYLARADGHQFAVLRQLT